MYSDEFLEPMSFVEASLERALLAASTQTGRVAVVGGGINGLLACASLRVRGFSVAMFGLTRSPNLNEAMLAALGASYHSYADQPLRAALEHQGPFDVVFHADALQRATPFVARKRLHQLDGNFPGWLERLYRHPAREAERRRTMLEHITAVVSGTGSPTVPGTSRTSPDRTAAFAIPA